jgi:hypothetical protein
MDLFLTKNIKIITTEFEELKGGELCCRPLWGIKLAKYSCLSSIQE